MTKNQEAKNSILLLDIGNTRAKWSYVSQVGRLSASKVDLGISCGNFNNAEPKQIASLLNKINPSTIACVGVVQEELIQQWNAACKTYWPNAHWLEFKSQTAFSDQESSLSIKNTYLKPDSLGADRWAALIGAQHLFPQTNVLVINAGTATTIDFLNQGGEFSGGWILPGLDLMLKSLAEGTAALPDLRQKLETLQSAKFGLSTDECILQGCIESQIGAILRAAEISQAQQIILSGGNAPILMKQLRLSTPKPLLMDSSIVLRGVYAWANLE
jgi:type III pantothenate kinase